MIKGSCLCGGVTLELTTDTLRVMHCHCKMCQKVHGGAVASFGIVNAEKLTLMGETFLSRFESSPGVMRSFCSKCGASVEWKDGSDFNKRYRSISLSLLDDDFNISRSQHWFSEDRPHWHP